MKEKMSEADKERKAAKERQRARRKKLKDTDMRVMYVRGQGGYYDEGVRISMAIKNLADRGHLPRNILEDIAEEAIECLPPKNNIDRLYLKKLMSQYLHIEAGEEKNE